MLPNTLYGATAIHGLDTKIGRIYIVSELHQNSNETPCNLREFVATWKKERPNLECWTEVNFLEKLLFKMQPTPKTPILASVQLDDLCNVATMNIRRAYPFHIIESLFAFSYFMTTSVYIPSGSIRENPELEQKIMILTKEFEKDLFQQIASRKGLMDFVISLIDPDKGLMPWYQKQLSNFEAAGVKIHSNDNPIHIVMKHIPKNTKNRILQTVRAHVAALTDNDQYSAVARSMMSTRRTNSAVVFDKYEELRTLFISIFAILMDVYILLYLSPKGPEATTVLVLGLSHSIQIVDFLQQNKLIEQGWLMYSHRPDLVHTSDIHSTLSLVETKDPIPLFEAFHEKRKRRI